MNFGILRLYCGESGQAGFYNLQELGLAKGMAKLGYNVYVILLDNNIKTIKIEKYNDNINFVTFPCKKIGNHGVFKCRYLLDLNINLLQISSDNQIYAPYIMKFCKKNNIAFYNYIGTLETDSNNKFKKIISNILRKRIIKSLANTKIFAKTPAVKEKLLKNGLKSVDLLPVGLDTSIIEPINLTKKEIFDQFNLNINKKYIIYVGRLEEYKNPLANIDLIKKLKEDYNLIIIGKGSLKEALISRINDENLQSRIKYIEQLPNIEVHKLFYISDYYVNFNVFEIFGMSILEAVYNGCTVIAFHAPGPDYILADNVGYLVDSVTEMANIINSNKLKERGTLKKIITEKFNWDKNAKIIDKYFKENNS